MSDLNKKIIYILDNNKDILKVMEHYCCNENLTVYTNTNATKALQEIVSIKPHIIVFDYNLKDISLKYFLYQLQLKHHCYMIAMININTYVENNSMIKDVLVKPFAVNDLHKAIKKAISSMHSRATKRIYSFDNHPVFEDYVAICKEKLKNLGIDYMGIDIHSENDVVVLWRNDHIKWQQYYTEAIKDKDFESHTFQKMTHIQDNFFIPITAWRNNLFDIRASIVGERKNGLFIVTYDPVHKNKVSYTLTFTNKNDNAFNINKDIVKEIFYNLSDFTGDLSFHFQNFWNC